MAENGATDESTGGESEIRSLSWGCAPGFVARDASTEPIEVLVWKIISCIAQSINVGVTTSIPGWLTSNGSEGGQKSGFSVRHIRERYIQGGR